MNSAPHTLPTIISAGIFDSSLIYPAEQKRTKNRRVSVYEIELPLESHGFSHMNEHRFAADTERILCAKPGQVRYTELPYKCLFIHFLAEDAYIKSICDRLPDQITLSERELYADCFNRLIAATLEPTEAGVMLAQSKLLELLSRLVREQNLLAESGEEKRNNAAIVKAAMAFMDGNLENDICLADIAAHVHLSKIYFHSLFKAATGLTPHRYLQNKRLSRAKTLLVSSGLGFAEIASLCGFSGQSHFGSSFKKETGFTPREYRKKSSVSWEA